MICMSFNFSKTGIKVEKCIVLKYMLSRRKIIKKSKIMKLILYFILNLGNKNHIEMAPWLKTIQFSKRKDHAE